MNILSLNAYFIFVEQKSFFKVEEWKKIIDMDALQMVVAKAAVQSPKDQHNERQVMNRLRSSRKNVAQYRPTSFDKWKISDKKYTKKIEPAGLMPVYRVFLKNVFQNLIFE